MDSSNTQIAIGRPWGRVTRMAGAGVDPFFIERCLNYSMGGVMSIYSRAECEQPRIDAAIALEVAVISIITKDQKTKETLNAA